MYTVTIKIIWNLQVYNSIVDLLNHNDQHLSVNALAVPEIYHKFDRIFRMFDYRWDDEAHMSQEQFDSVAEYYMVHREADYVQWVWPC